MKNQATMGESLRGFRSGRQSGLEKAQRLGGPSLLETQNPQQVIGIEILWLTRKHIGVQPLSQGPVAPLLGIQRPMQKRLRVHPINQRDRICVA